MPKAIKVTIIAILLVLSLALSFQVGYTLGINSFSNPGLDVVEQAWKLIYRDYVDRDKLDAGALSQAAIEGMIETLNDPYTSYMDAETFQLGEGHLEGKFEGIGAYVGAQDDQIVIIAPVPDSPAAKAGIRAGDVILEIDGQSTSGMSLAEAVLNIRGPEGTPVMILILHQDETEPVEIEVIRAEIELPSVVFEMKDDIAYINITHFSERTNEELLPMLQDISKQEAVGIILDLRSNPGGLLEVVVDVASNFLTEGIVVSLVDNKGTEQAIEVRPPNETIDLPMVVLIDSFSASGSEVLAGALQDYDRTIVAGNTTYGKGSVNALHQLKDGSALYITTARWLTPDGRPIEGKGIEPDIELELEGDNAIQWAIDYLKNEE